MLKVLHILERLTSGGPTRSMIAGVKYSSQLGIAQQHRVITLQPTVYPMSLILAKQAGMTVLRQPDRNTILCEIENADIVHVHFWNNPEIYKLLRSELPAMRLLLWFTIIGDEPPQIITKQLVDYSDFALTTSPFTLKLNVFQELPVPVKTKKTGVVYGIADFSRLTNLQFHSHDAFNVGYIGTVNFAKMHPNYVPMSAQIDIPNVRFIVCGGGIQKELQKKAQQLGVAERFDFRGYVENIKSIIETLDVFGYPLCQDTYAASESSLQEAMYAGVPSVVFPYGGVKCLIENNETGLIVNSELEYKQAIEYLYHHPQERVRLGHNAREYAQRMFGSENAAKKLHLIYERIMELPKHQRAWGILLRASSLEEPVSVQDLTGQSKKLSPAELFIQSLGDKAPQFSVSMNSQNIEELLAADQKIASSSMLLSGGEGGIIQYRNYYPSDGYLRLWSGLVMQQQGQNAKAVHEFQAAIKLGCNHCRVNWYLAQVVGNSM